MKKERILKEKVLFENAHFQLKEATIDFANSSIGQFQYIGFSPVRHANASVMIAALDGTDLYLIEEYQVGVDDRLLVLPRGGIPQGVTPEQQAQNELQEEIGYRAKNLQFLTRLEIFPGYLQASSLLFLATELQPSMKEGDEKQTIVIHKMPLEKALRLIDTGKIIDSRTVAGVLFLDRRLRTQNV